MSSITEKLQPKRSKVLERETPFEADGSDAAHLPRMTREEVMHMTDQEVDAAIEGTTLKGISFPKILTNEQLYISKKLILVNRDVFAKNDKNPAICNANGVVIDTGNAKPQVYPLRPVLPNMRPVVNKHLD